MKKYFTSQFVWKRIDESHAIRYLCLFDLSSKKYAVQNADFFFLPITKERLLESDLNGVELFIDVSPSERCDWYDDILEAVADHELNFS